MNEHDKKEVMNLIKIKKKMKTTNIEVFYFGARCNGKVFLSKLNKEVQDEAN